MQSLDDQPASLDTDTHRRAQGRPWARRLELALLLSGALGLAFWSVRSGGAPVVVAALLGVLPAIVGLQHGFFAALGLSLAGFCALWLGPAGARLEATAAVLAPYALALAVGHYSDRTRKIRRQLEERGQEQGRQLEQLFRAHSVLRASHAQLEERLAAREWSLDAAVREAERQVGGHDLAGAAHALLELLASQGRVVAASLYVARNGELPAQADARIGPAPERAEPGRLVRMAFAHATLVSLEGDDARADAEENVLLALPLCTTGGQVVGVVAVHELPFVAFHDAHFRLLATLIAPFSDALARKAASGDAPARLTPTPARGSLPPPTRALARLRQTQLGIPTAPRVEPPPLPTAQHARGDEGRAVEHADDAHEGDEPEDDETTIVSGSDPDLTVEVDESALLAVAEVVVVEFDIAAPEPSLQGAPHSEAPEPASANTNAEGILVSASGELAAQAAGPRESEPEIVLTQAVAAPSNDAADDDPTRLHAGPPGSGLS